MPTTSIWSETGAGTTSGVFATHAASAGKLHICRHISGHTDADATITIRDGDNTATVLAQWTIDVSLNGNSFAINIPDGVFGTPGNAITGDVSASTAVCQVNIGGYSNP